MRFYSEEHRAQIRRLEELWSALHDISALSKEHGIEDIFQDNGAKTAQQLTYLNFKNLPGREGNDAIDCNGVEWEMKSINLETSASGFSTNHHTNHVIIAKYRRVPWSFSIYRGVSLREIYVMTPNQLEPMFQHWEKKLETMAHLNNPKIPVKFVRANGILVYPIDPENPFDPSRITRDMT